MPRRTILLKCTAVMFMAFALAMDIPLRSASGSAAPAKGRQTAQIAQNTKAGAGKHNTSKGPAKNAGASEGKGAVRGASVNTTLMLLSAFGGWEGEDGDDGCGACDCARDCDSCECADEGCGACGCDGDCDSCECADEGCGACGCDGDCDSCECADSGCGACNCDGDCDSCECADAGCGACNCDGDCDYCECAYAGCGACYCDGDCDSCECADNGCGCGDYYCYGDCSFCACGDEVCPCGDDCYSGCDCGCEEAGCPCGDDCPPGCNCGCEEIECECGDDCYWGCDCGCDNGPETDCECGEDCYDGCDCGCEGEKDCPCGDDCDSGCDCGCEDICYCDPEAYCGGACDECDCVDACDCGGDPSSEDCDCAECYCKNTEDICDPCSEDYDPDLCQVLTEGANPFTLDGNVSRKVTDLTMTGSEPLEWSRYHNSMPRLVTPAFGQGGAWKHNWQYELQERNTGKTRELLLTYPTGIKRSFEQQQGGSFSTIRERYKEKARAIGNRLEITTRDEEIVVFERMRGSDGAFRVLTLTNKDGEVTHYKHDKKGRLQTITNEAGSQIVIYYDEEASDRIIRVETSDGRAVDYEYENRAESGKGPQYATLVRAHYGDGTSAEYKYDFATPGRAPLLVEADDPRYDGRAKHVGYRYQKKARGTRYGQVREEYNPLTGKAYVTLEFDRKDPEKRTIRYTDDRTITYRVPRNTNGRATERIDSLGRKRTWTYDNDGKGSVMAKTLADGKTITYARDQKGRITRETHSDGLVLDHEHDQSGKVIKSRDNRGHVTEFVRDAKGRILQTSKTTAGSQNLRASKGGAKQNIGRTKKESTRLDASGRPLRKDYFDGTYEELARDSRGNVVTRRDRKGGLHHYTYAERGLIASETDPTGHTTLYSYNRHGQRVTQTDALGNTTTWERNERGLVTRLVNADGSQRIYAYDKYGRKISEIDEIGRTTTWEYDNLTRVTSQTDSAGGTIRFDYTETPGGCGTCSLVSNATRITQPDGRVDEFLYDTEGRMLMGSIAVGTGQMATTLYAYDDADNLVQQTNPDGGIITHTYDHNKRRLSATDPLGRTISWTYDDEGNKLTQTDASGRTTDYAYDADNNLIYQVTADGAETTHEYDAASRRIRTTDAMDNTTRWVYDEAGNLVTVIDAAGDETRHDHDEAGRRIRTTFPDGTTQTWEYNALGKVSQTTTADGLKVENEYDAMRRITASTSTPVGTFGAPAITRTTYDAAGRRTSITDPLNRTTRYEYNARNQVTVITYPDGTQMRKEYNAAGWVIGDINQLGHATRYTYTALGDQATLTDANGSIYAFEYDAMRRKTAMVYPDNTQETWDYNPAGQIIAYTTRAGQTKTIIYNFDGKPLSETWLPSGSAPDVAYTYDDNGRLASADNGNALLTYSYDKLGRITSETTDIRALLPNIAPHTVGYMFGARGRKTGLMYPDAMKVTYSYDVQGRMTEVRNGNTKPLATYAYDAYGRRAKLIRDNGVVTNYTYDLAGQVLGIDHLDQGNTPLAFAHYEYDSRGRRTSMTRENNQTDRYLYDATNQLTGVDYGSMRAEAFTYDALGNRIEHTDASVNQASIAENYTTNNLNQYTQVADTSLLYDPNGNLIDDGKQHYTYDAQNRLIKVESAVIRAEFAYDARSRCILREYYTLGTDGMMTLDTKNSVVMTYDTSWNIISDRTLYGKQIATYIHGNRIDEILIQNRDAGQIYPLNDAINSTIGVTEREGSVSELYYYNIFGKPKSESRNYRYLYTGREWLHVIEYSEHRNRYYDPNKGRWTAVDPIRFQGGINLLAYVGNAPTIRVDWSGLACCEAEKAALDAAELIAQLALNSANAALDNINRIADDIRDASREIELDLNNYINADYAVDGAFIVMVGSGVAAIVSAPTAVGTGAALTVFVGSFATALANIEMRDKFLEDMELHRNQLSSLLNSMNHGITAYNDASILANNAMSQFIAASAIYQNCILTP